MSSMVEQWVKDITESTVGGPPLEVGKRYLHPIDGVIEVTSGQYWGTHGLSNFWYWRVLETGESKHGYGQSWPEATVELLAARLARTQNALADQMNYNDRMRERLVDKNHALSAAIGALARVEGLHQPHQYIVYGKPTGVTVCKHCDDDLDGATDEWPCPTIRALKDLRKGSRDAGT